MAEKRMNLSLDMLRTIAALSHVLSWGQYWVYTTLLYERDPHTLRVRVDQKEIANATGYTVRTVKYFLSEFQAMGLIRKWRGPEGGNYHELLLPLPDTVIERIREKIPAFGRELELSCKRKRGFKGGTEETVSLAGVVQQLPIAADNVFPVQDTLVVHEQLCIPQEEQPMGESIIPEEVTPDTTTTTSESPELALDPEISTLLASLERRPVRNSAVHFLASLGFVEPQLSLEQRTVVDREGLLAYLVEHEANTVTKFCGLIQEFTESPDQTRLPYIDVPISDPITLRIYRKLDLYPCGIQWLRKVVAWKDINGSSLTNREIRQNLYNFMKENGIMTFDAVMAMAKEKHCGIVNSKKSAPYVPPEQFGLGAYIQ